MCNNKKKHKYLHYIMSDRILYHCLRGFFFNDHGMIRLNFNKTKKHIFLYFSVKFLMKTIFYNSIIIHVWY